MHPRAVPSLREAPSLYRAGAQERTRGAASFNLVLSQWVARTLHAALLTSSTSLLPSFASATSS